MPSEFKTEDYSLATWLVFNKVTLMGAIRFPNNPRQTFVFLPVENLGDLIEDWSTPQSERARLFRRYIKAHTIVRKSLETPYDIGSMPNM